MRQSFEDRLATEIPRGFDGAEDQVSDARWATPTELDASWSYDRAGVFLGYRGGRGIGRNDDRHVLTVAGSRAGKGVSLVVPNMLLYGGSVLATDPKGELAAETKAQRERDGHACFVLDPFNANRRWQSASYNPMAEIDPDSPEAVDDADMLADALIIHEAGDPHWTDSAKLLLRSLILLTLTFPAKEQTLVTVRMLLMLQHPFLQDLPSPDKDATNVKELTLFHAMIGQDDRFNSVLAGAGAAFLEMSERERSAIFSTARTQTAFLDSRPLQETLRHSDFRLADLKRSKTTVYLCLPASRMATHAKWFRIIINLAMTIFEREPTKPSPPVLLLLDEFPVLGHMHRLEVAAGQIAGFGVKLWTILQDLTQLQRHYKEGWETFIGNAGVLTFFGNADVTTLKYIGEKLGTRGYKLAEASKASLSAQLSGVAPINENLRVDPLLATHEIERLFARETERVLVLMPGSRPVILQRANYVSDPAFAGMTISS